MSHLPRFCLTFLFYFYIIFYSVSFWSLFGEWHYGEKNGGTVAQGNQTSIRLTFIGDTAAIDEILRIIDSAEPASKPPKREKQNRVPITEENADTDGSAFGACGLLG